MLAANALEVRGADRPRLQDVSLEVLPGEILAVVGPNGAGKSTLLHCLCGTLKPRPGEVLLGGRPLVSWPDHLRARSMAVLPQASTLRFPYQVREVVQLGRLPHTTTAKQDRAIVQESLERCGIAQLGHRDYLELSGGEQHRVHLARVIAQIARPVAGPVAGMPRVLLLDEPVSDLDPAQQHAILELLRTLASEGVAIVLSLHDLSLADRFARRVAVLDSGRLAAWACPSKALTPARVRSVFGVESATLDHPLGGRHFVVTGRSRPARHVMGVS